MKNRRREKYTFIKPKGKVVLFVMELFFKCPLSGDDADLPSRKLVGSCVEPFNRSNQGGRGKWHSELHTQILIRDFRFRFDRLVCVEWIFIHYRGWIILIKICFLWNCFVLS